MPPEIEARCGSRASRWPARAGAGTVVEISPAQHRATRCPPITWWRPAEASANTSPAMARGALRAARRAAGRDRHALYEAHRAEGFGREVRRRVLIGTYVLSAGYYDAYHLKAQKVRALIARDFAEAWKTVDAIVTPATLRRLRRGREAGRSGGDVPERRLHRTANLAGLPAMSVPAGLDAKGLPLGCR